MTFPSSVISVCRNSHDLCFSHHEFRRSVRNFVTLGPRSINITGAMYNLNNNRALNYFVVTIDLQNWREWCLSLRAFEHLLWLFSSQYPLRHLSRHVFHSSGIWWLTSWFMLGSDVSAHLFYPLALMLRLGSSVGYLWCSLLGFLFAALKIF